MTYQDIKKKRENDTNKLFTDLGVFWAFSDKQFKEGLEKIKTENKISQDEKLVDIGAGGFMPSKNVDAMLKGMEDIANTFKAQIKDAKAREQHILYELNNHEAFYTGSTESTMDALGDDYTEQEVREVYKTNKKQYA